MADPRFLDTNRMKFVERKNIQKLVDGKYLTEAQATTLRKTGQVVAEEHGLPTLVRVVN